MFAASMFFFLLTLVVLAFDKSWLDLLPWSVLLRPSVLLLVGSVVTFLVLAVFGFRSKAQEIRVITQDLKRELDEAERKEALRQDALKRCAVCMYNLAEHDHADLGLGCVRGRCMYRPVPTCAFDPARAAAEKAAFEKADTPADPIAVVPGPPAPEPKPATKPPSDAHYAMWILGIGVVCTAAYALLTYAVNGGQP